MWRKGHFVKGHHKFPRSNEGKLLHHLFDVKDDFVHQRNYNLPSETGSFGLGQVWTSTFLVGCFVIGGGHRALYRVGN
jgi:hypothetical protein